MHHLEHPDDGHPVVGQHGHSVYRHAAAALSGDNGEARAPQAAPLPPPLTAPDGQLYREFGWRIYKRVGGNPRLVRYYTFHLVLLTLVKLAVPMIIIFLIMHLVLLLPVGSAEFFFNLTGIPLAFFVTYLIVYSVRAAASLPACWMAPADVRTRSCGARPSCCFSSAS